MSPTTSNELQALPLRHFDESVGLDDPRPFEGWEPSPRQIREWAAIIRSENGDGHHSEREKLQEINR